MTTDNRAESQWQAGNVVQLSPETSNPLFSACFMVVTEPKPWGAQGYVKVPGGGRAYYRAKNQHMTYIGNAAWVGADDE